jgi:hypothetical protein
MHGADRHPWFLQAAHPHYETHREALVLSRRCWVPRTPSLPAAFSKGRAQPIPLAVQKEEQKKVKVTL